MPLLDDDHVLIGGTTALHTLDLDTGAITSAPLPTDGINTTYWPYQVAVSPGVDRGRDQHGGCRRTTGVAASIFPPRHGRYGEPRSGGRMRRDDVWLLLPVVALAASRRSLFSSRRRPPPLR